MDNQSEKPTDSNPLERVVILLMIINVIYWCFSEVYIHDGSIITGAIYGVIASFLSLAFGALIAYEIKRSKTIQH